MKDTKGLLIKLVACILKRKPHDSHLSVSDVAFDMSLSNDRIIVENSLSRLCGLWTSLYSKWRWSERIYDDFFCVALAFAKYHVELHPLRAIDSERFQPIKSALETLHWRDVSATVVFCRDKGIGVVCA